MDLEHVCAWEHETPEEHARVVQGIRVVDIVIHATCACGKRQPTRRGTPRLPSEQRRESAGPSRVMRSDANTLVAKVLLANGSDDVPWPGSRSKLIQKGLTDNEMGAALDEFTRAGWIVVHARRKGTEWETRRARVLDRAALEEHFQPGHRARVAAAVRAALDHLPNTTAAEPLRTHLQAGAPGWDEKTVTWAARLARHAASGRSVLLRQFSATWGLSKEFEDHEARIERVLGAISELGIIDAASLLFVAGRGTLTWPSKTIAIDAEIGIIGLERHVLSALTRVDASQAIFVENKTVFEAIAKNIVPDLVGFLCIYTGGNIGSTIRHVASVTRCPILVWADLDPEGVRIMRRIYDASGKTAQAYRMTPEELAASTDDLDEVRLKTLDDELARGGPLQDLLEAIKRTGHWREQERQLPPAGGLQQGEAP